MISTPHVVVVGGGPAGSAAAITLAKQGIRVSLYEAKRFPRHLLCGEFLSPECASTLSTLAPELALSELGAVPIRVVRITAGDRSSWCAPLPGMAYGLSRARLDGALLETAQKLGVEVNTGCQVVAIDGKLDAGFRVTIQQDGSFHQIQTRAVIGGQGKRSVLDAALGRTFFTRTQPFVALKAHFQGPALPGRIELHAFPGGYCGLSEIEGDLRNLCLLASQPIFRKKSQGKKTPVENFIAWMQTQNPHLREWLSQGLRIQSWISIAQIPFCFKPAIEKDVLMAGDAAGLIVPLAGDGIAMALDGGQLASVSLAHYLTGDWNAEELRQAYPNAWQKRFGNRIRLGRALQPLLLHTQAAGLFVRFLSVFPALGQALIANTRGKSSNAYRTV